MVVKLEYFLNLADSTEFASMLALLEEVDILEGARVLEQIKFQSSDKPYLQEIKDIASSLLPPSRYTPTGSKTADIHPKTPEHDGQFH